VLAGCQGSQGNQPAGPAVPYGLDDVVRVLEEAAFQVSGGEALALDETGTATLRAGTVVCHCDAHIGNVLISDDGDVWLLDWDEVVRAPGSGI